MGLGEGSSNFRVRTVWTPEMDRYFIDLMLEQVGKETRRDDHLFSKRGWNHMTTMFNANFDSNYEKDVLKNRHKMLRNLYRGFSNILEQKGFRWDESGETVTADNGDWDSYIKANPNARPYRLKTVPYYLDLVKIYGTTVGFGGESTISRKAAFCNGRLKSDVDPLLAGEKVVDTSVDDDEELCSNVLKYSPSLGENVNICQMATESLHDIMIGEDFGVETADETCQFLSDIGYAVGARSRTYWQPQMDHYFIQLMLEQVRKRNHVDGLLRKQAWKEMILLFNAKFGFDYAVGILKNRYKTLRRQHNLIKNLLEVDGFAWDDMRKMVVADDCVWQNYIKVHSGTRQYMTRPIPHHEDLCSIFRELNSDEKDGILSHQNVEIHDESPAASVSSYEQFPSEKGSSASCLNTSVANELGKRQLDPLPATGSSKKSRSENEGVVLAIREIATAVSCLADKRKGDENANTIPVETVVAAIQALPDMDEELVLDACDLLEDEKKAKTFMALDVKLRKKWLTRKLRPLNL